MESDKVWLLSHNTGVFLVFLGDIGCETVDDGKEEVTFLNNCSSWAFDVRPVGTRDGFKKLFWWFWCADKFEATFESRLVNPWLGIIGGGWIMLFDGIQHAGLLIVFIISNFDGSIGLDVTVKLLVVFVFVVMVDVLLLSVEVIVVIGECKCIAYNLWTPPVSKLIQ